MRNSRQIGKMDDPYVPAIKRLFDSYGVPVLDVQMLVTLLAKTEYDPKDWYANDAHYKLDTPLPVRIVETALLMHRQARPPVQRPDRAAHFDLLDLHLLQPDNAPHETRTNNVMSILSDPTPATPESQSGPRADAPVSVHS